MAQKFAADLDLMGIGHLVNTLLEGVAGNPSSPVDGRIWWDTATSTVKVQLGGSTIDLRSRAQHTGSQTASTISDFTAAVQTLRWASMAQPNAAVPMNNQKVTGLAAGESSGEAVEYGQFQAGLATVAAGVTFKRAVRAISTTNITLSGAQTVDGIGLVAGDRVLVAGQSTPSANGIYIVGSGAWARASDADSTGELAGGTVVAVDQGTAYADTLWMLTTNGQITPGSTDQTWARFGAGTNYVGQAPIVVSGGTISLNVGPLLTTSGGNLTVDISSTVHVGRVITGLIPAASAGIYTVSGSQVVINHGLNNPAPNFVLRGGGSPISGVGTGQRVHVDDVASDANNLAVQLPSAPNTGNWSFTING